MPKVRVHNLAVSLDGYAAGPEQSVDHPLGVRGERLHEWVFKTRCGRRMIGMEGGAKGVDDEFMARGEVGIGATIMGRNMFGPSRGPWGNDPWTGWWGPDPPYHHPVFVLTNHPRPSLTMEGGTTFYFVDEGIGAALERALDAADGNDVRIGGGPSVIRQFLRAGLIDDMHIAIVPILLGGGERLLDNLDGVDGYECAELVSSDSVAHVRLCRIGG